MRSGLSHPATTVPHMNHPDCRHAPANTDNHTAATNTTPGADMLTPHQRAVLDLENQHWTHAGAKEEAIVTQLGILPARYWQIVGALLDDPEAMAYAPLLVGRLRRLRDARVAARTG